VRTATESRRKSPVEMNVRSESRPPAAMSGDLLIRTAEIAADWLQSLDRRPVAESATVDELRSRLGGPLPRNPVDPLVVVEDLARAAEPGLVAIPLGPLFRVRDRRQASRPRSRPDWLTSVWDQCPGFYACGPGRFRRRRGDRCLARAVARAAGACVVAFVTGCQMSHITCLAAARHHVLHAVGWERRRAGPERLPAHPGPGRRPDAT